jgi:hypothetical protein
VIYQQCGAPICGVPSLEVLLSTVEAPIVSRLGSYGAAVQVASGLVDLEASRRKRIGYCFVCQSSS